ncbi:septum site-determining protein MinC [Reinekea sp.]|uniref:septum site-determining protein MinC n=1 Tax=Reinekea sp. TaxID=1970455 RepID=UPI002A8371E7|nr:septum site-determining protein MinC [Reinekea sp.]
MNQITNTPLKLRNRLVASHQIPVTSLIVSDFQPLLASTLKKAPALFLHAPTILDLSTLEGDIDPRQLSAIIATCRAENLIPYALTGDRTRHQALAFNLNLAWIDSRSGQDAKNNSAPLVEPTDGIRQTEVITTPIRSGQQVYARNAHLLIMNQVSAGAEIVADGNIHVFGTLRGRAIAGAQGQDQSEVVCQQMQAELIAIAGTYMVQDDFPEGSGPARCRLVENNIFIDYL